MANHASHAGLPYPVKGARFTVPVPYLDADGDPTDPTTPDTEISKDGGAFADCAEEVTTISGSNGAGYITLSGAETDCSFAFLAAKVASGPKNTLATLYPRVLPVIFSGTASAGAAGTITVATDVPAVTNLLSGCIIRTTGGTGGGGTGGANNQARVITAMNSSRVCTVVPDWETNPSSDTTYEILLTEASLLRYADLRLMGGVAQSAADLKDFADDCYDPSANIVQAQDPWNTATGGYGAGTFGLLVATNLDATVSSRATQTSVDTIDNFLDTEIAGIITTLGTAGDGLTDVPWNSAWTAEIADATWDAPIASHQDAGSTGEALGDASSAGDPWSTALPGSYTSGQAGFIVGTNLDATVGSRASQTSVNTIDDFLDTEIASIISTLSTNLDVAVSTRASQTSVDAIDNFLDTEIGSPSNFGSGASLAANFVDLEALVDGVETGIAAIQSNIGLAGAGLTAITNLIDTEITTLLTRLGTPVDLGSGATVAFNLVDIEAGLGGSGTGGSTDVNLISVDGNTDVIDQIIAMFRSDGGGYGPLVLRTTVDAATTQTDLVLNESSAENNSYIGCPVIIRRQGGPLDIIQGIVTGNSDISLQFLPVHVPGFTIVAGDIVEILGPSFVELDRDVLDDISDTVDGIASGTGNNVNLVSINGETIPVDNLEAFLTTGYGPLIGRTTIAAVNSQTANQLVVELDGLSQAAGEPNYNGCTAVIRATSNDSPDDVWIGFITSHSIDPVTVTVKPQQSVPFTVAAGDTIEILPPGIMPSDRTSLQNVEEDLAGGSGGGVLSARIGYSSLTPDHYLEIIQGEEKVITFIVEADGRFVSAEAGEIRVVMRDPEDNEVELEDGDVTRITEELDVQIIRVTLAPEDTTSLTEGLLRIEIAFDNQKARLTHALKIVESILG